MPTGKLSALQERVLRALAGLRPRWILTGGGALAGVYTQHRTTRDLDLFWRGEERLGNLPRDVTGLLKSDGLAVETIQSAPAFCRLRVTEGVESVVVDLVADPVAAVEQPREFAIEGTPILVDSEHEILVSKLCTLVERSELRDLLDVQVLLQAGGDLARALVEAPRKDAGFSPLTLAWVLRELPIRPLGRASGWAEDLVSEVERFRDELAQRVASLAAPD